MIWEDCHMSYNTHKYCKQAGEIQAVNQPFCHNRVAYLFLGWFNSNGFSSFFGALMCVQKLCIIISCTNGIWGLIITIMIWGHMAKYHLNVWIEMFSFKPIDLMVDATGIRDCFSQNSK